MPLSGTNLNPKIFESMVNAMPISAFIIDDHRNIVYANQKVLSHFGYNRQALLAKTLEKLLAEDIRDEAVKHIDDFIRSDEKDARVNDGLEEIHARRVDESTFPAEMTLVRVADKSMYHAHVCVFITDISRQSKLAHYLQNVISIDPITNLLNRRAFEERMRKEHEREQRRDRIYGIFLMDIYHLRDINDTYGHETGDKAIRIFADYCRNFFRKSDVIARWGDDEFIAFLPEVTQDNALSISERLINSVRGITFKSASGHKDVEIAVNIGICLSSPINSYHAVITRANESLIKAKAKAPNEVVMELLNAKS